MSGSLLALQNLLSLVCQTGRTALPATLAWPYRRRPDLVEARRMEEFMVFFTTFLGAERYLKNAGLRCDPCACLTVTKLRAVACLRRLRACSVRFHLHGADAVHCCDPLVLQRLPCRCCIPAVSRGLLSQPALHGSAPLPSITPHGVLVLRGLPCSGKMVQALHSYMPPEASGAQWQYACSTPRRAPSRLPSLLAGRGHGWSPPFVSKLHTAGPAALPALGYFMKTW